MQGARQGTRSPTHGTLQRVCTRLYLRGLAPQPRKGQTVRPRCGQRSPPGRRVGVDAARGQLCPGERNVLHMRARCEDEAVPVAAAVAELHSL